MCCTDALKFRLTKKILSVKSNIVVGKIGKHSSAHQKSKAQRSENLCIKNVGVQIAQFGDLRKPMCSIEEVTNYLNMLWTGRWRNRNLVDMMIPFSLSMKNSALYIRVSMLQYSDLHWHSKFTFWQVCPEWEVNLFFLTCFS